MTRATGVVAIIQARMGSTRLPGKSLADICGKPLLVRVIERSRAARLIHRVIVATTTSAADDLLAARARDAGVSVFRGSDEDVLDRYVQAAREAGAAVVVRITADDPFKDPEVIDLVTQELLRDPSVEYASNTIEPSFPEGLDVEAVRMTALEQAWREATDPGDREHVTPFVWRQPQRFQLRSVRLEEDLSALRWTIDYPEDLEFARAVYRRMEGEVFGYRAILRLLEREPEVARLMPTVPRYAGYHGGKPATARRADNGKQR